MADEARTLAERIVDKVLELDGVSSHDTMIGQVQLILDRRCDSGRTARAGTCIACGALAGEGCLKPHD